MSNGQKEQKNGWKIDWRSLMLGIALNILVIIVFILLYHAYFVKPKMEGGAQVPLNPIEQQPSQ